jgi:hypothetical protein
MGRTIPSFRIAAVLEEKEWKLFTNYLNKMIEKHSKKCFQLPGYTILHVPMLLFQLEYIQ